MCPPVVFGPSCCEILATGLTWQYQCQCYSRAVIFVPSTAENLVDKQTKPKALEPQNVFTHSQTVNRSGWSHGSSARIHSRKWSQNYTFLERTLYSTVTSVVTRAVRNHKFRHQNFRYLFFAPSSVWKPLSPLCDDGICGPLIPLRCATA